MGSGGPRAADELEVSSSDDSGASLALPGEGRWGGARLKGSSEDDEGAADKDSTVEAEDAATFKGWS